MQFTIERSTLLAALTKISGMIDGRSTIPILNHVRVEVGDGAMTIMGTNLDIEGTVKVQCAVTKPGVTTLPAQRLLDIAKTANEGADISFELKDKMLIKSGRSRFNVGVLPAIDYPTFAPMEGSCTRFEVTAPELKSLLRCSFAMGTDRGRQYLCGVNLFARDNQLIAIATDGLRLCMATAALTLEEFGVIIPSPLVAEITKLVETATTVTVTLNASKVQCATADAILTGKLYSHAFSDYRRVIPRDLPNTLTVDGDAMKATIRRAAVAIEDKSNSARLTIDGDLMTITARTQGGEVDAEDQVEIDYDGEPTQLGVNSTHVLQAIEAADCDAVTLMFADKNSGMIIRGADDFTLTSVTMPLRV